MEGIVNEHMFHRELKLLDNYLSSRQLNFIDRKILLSEKISEMQLMLMAHAELEKENERFNDR